MIKTYRADSIIAVQILVKGNNRRIVFDEDYGGSSVYTTGDKDVQRALEKSAMFNSWFTLENTTGSPEPKPEQSTSTRQEKGAVKVSSVAEARDYLVDTFDCTRSSLRTKEAVLKIAEELGITFEGV